MFKVYLLNQGFQVGDNYTTIDEATNKAKSTGFECVIIETNLEKKTATVIMEYSPVYMGFKSF
jgi:hypothetical protein